MLKMVGFLKPIKIGQKLVDYAKIQTFKCDILSNFQTLWLPLWIQWGKIGCVVYLEN